MKRVLAEREWLGGDIRAVIDDAADFAAARDADAVEKEIDRLAALNRQTHEADCVNLNPATNVMNPRAEALLAAGLGNRPSLGYPGDKYEMGLEAMERIEVIAQELAAETFGARFVEYRVGSGALANLYAFMAMAEPGDAIIVPPASIGGHVTHNRDGAAGLYRLAIHEAPVDAANYTVDVAALERMAREVRPKVISIGGSLNLAPHPLREIREIADGVGARVLFDAAHLCGVIAGGAWQQPLEEGAHAMTMSTYKSLGGPPAGLIVTNEPDLARRLEEIAFPGLTANFDSGKTASLAVALLDWRVHGKDYARTMVETAQALAEALAGEGLPVHRAGGAYTTSHQVAVQAAPFGGGQTASKRLRKANILACGIGLPIAEVAGDMNGLRLGTPEIVRFGMTAADMPELARLIARALTSNEPPAELAAATTAFRRRFDRLHFIR